MQHPIRLLALAVLLGASSASAAILDVTGPASTFGAAPEIIDAPSSVLVGGATNLGMQGFDEAQDVILSQDYATDQGSILAGTRVDSHMILLNTTGRDVVYHSDVLWTFDGVIIGIMSDEYGAMEVASSGELGAAGTSYLGAPLYQRGLDPRFDAYSILGNQLRIQMSITTPGDWIRVVTATPETPREEAPEPGTLALFGAGLAALVRLRYRQRSSK